MRRPVVLLSLLAGFATGVTVVACASDGELNPQPLPPVTSPEPGDDDTTDPVGGGSSTSGSSSGFSSSGSSGSSGVQATPPTDAGTDADAGAIP